MRFFLSNLRRAESGARALKDALAERGHEAMHTRCQRAVALALGYDAWPELKAVTRAAAHPPSPLDHEAGDRALVEDRLRQHAAAIASVFGLDGAEPLEIAAAIGLTAARGGQATVHGSDLVPDGAAAAPAVDAGRKGTAIKPGIGLAAVVGGAGQPGEPAPSFTVEDPDTGAEIMMVGAMLTSAGGPLETSADMRSICALTEDGAFLVSRSHRFDPRVLSLHARAKGLGYTVNPPIPVGLATIKKAYDLAGKLASSEPPCGDGATRLQSIIQEVMADGGRLIADLAAQALDCGATNMTILRQDRRCVVRCRAHGRMVQLHEGPEEEHQAMALRIKRDAGIDVAEADGYATGALTIRMGGGERRATVMMIPTVSGVMMTLRFDDPARRRLSLSDLGLTGVEEWVRGVIEEGGLSIVAGGTDCGRSTTLGAIVRELEKAGRVVCYLGQESDRPSDTALHMASRSGAASASLEAAMRSDADVIVVDDAADPAVVQQAVRAGGLNRTVVIGIHAGSIRGVLHRLQDLGVGVEQAMEALRGILVQSLVPNPGGSRFAASECALFDAKSRRADEALAGRTWWRSMAQDKNDKLSAYASAPGSA